MDVYPIFEEVHTKCSYSLLSITPQLVDNRNLKKNQATLLFKSQALFE